MLALYEYRAVLSRIVNSHTLRMSIDTGFGDHTLRVLELAEVPRLPFFTRGGDRQRKRIAEWTLEKCAWTPGGGPIIYVRVGKDEARQLSTYVYASLYDLERSYTAKNGYLEHSLNETLMVGFNE